MSRKATKRHRLEQERRSRRIMMTVFVAVLIAGMCLQVAMMSRLSGRNKQVQTVEGEIRELTATADNLNLSLNQFRNLDRVAAQAERLGMDKPTQEQIRVVQVPDIVENASAQSAGVAGAGEMNP